MLAAFTDDGAGLGDTSPIQAHRAALDGLESGTDLRQEKRKQALECASLANLKKSLRKAAEAMNEGGAMLVSRELTRRGIAPAFRGIPVRNDPWWQHPTDETAFILLFADLEWLSVRYPEHKAASQHTQKALKPEKLEAMARWLHWDGNRQGAQIASRLRLEVAQQRELTYVQFWIVQQWIENLELRLPAAEAAIWRDINSRPWKTDSLKEATAKRRLDIWHCAQLAYQKPQRAADFYRMMTGEEITRQAIANQMAQLPLRVRRSP